MLVTGSPVAAAVAVTKVVLDVLASGMRDHPRSRRLAA